MKRAFVTSLALCGIAVTTACGPSTDAGATTSDGGNMPGGNDAAQTDDGGDQPVFCLDGQDLTGCSCPSTGATRACFTGSPAQRGQPGCQDGMQVCGGGEFPAWSACTGSVTTCMPATGCIPAEFSSCDGGAPSDLQMSIDGPSHCGNGVCGSDENCSTCPTDCGCGSTMNCMAGQCMPKTMMIMGGPHCTFAYPFASANPRTNYPFNESTVLKASAPDVGQPGDTIKVWFGDESPLSLGVSEVIEKTKNGPTSTSYPFAQLTKSPDSAIHPAVGSTVPTGVQAGNDPFDRPLWPALFLTDITSNPQSTSGDWQMGGVGVPPSAVFGVWVAQTRTVDETYNPPHISNALVPNPAIAANGTNLGSGDPFPSAPSGEKTFGAEVRWNVSELPIQSGHTYRVQVMVHDGDGNNSGGDAGEACMTIVVP